MSLIRNFWKNCDDEHLPLHVHSLIVPSISVSMFFISPLNFFSNTFFDCHKFLLFVTLTNLVNFSDYSDYEDSSVEFLDRCSSPLTRSSGSSLTLRSMFSEKNTSYQYPRAILSVDLSGESRLAGPKL